MSNKIDKFGNPINIGDVIAYFGTTVGLVVGTVVKFNPKSYKIMTKKISNGKTLYYYYQVLFDSKYYILTAKGLAGVKPEDMLDNLESQRLGLIT